MWVLIVILVSAKGDFTAVHTHEFSSQQRCKYAAQFLEVMQSTRRADSSIYYDCTPK